MRRRCEESVRAGDDGGGAGGASNPGSDPPGGGGTRGGSGAVSAAGTGAMAGLGMPGNGTSAVSRSSSTRSSGDDCPAGGTSDGGAQREIGRDWSSCGSCVTTPILPTRPNNGQPGSRVGSPGRCSAAYVGDDAGARSARGLGDRGRSEEHT